MQNDTETTACGNDTVRTVAQESAAAQNFTPEITPTLERVARALSSADNKGDESYWYDFVLHAQAAIDVMDGWLPIETAPDDTQIWVNIVDCDGDTEQCIAVKFNDEWTDQFGHEIEFPVTHWMPLPEPPKQYVNDTQAGSNMASGGL
jgi:hypothetical protein